MQALAPCKVDTAKAGKASSEAGMEQTKEAKLAGVELGKEK